MGKQTLKKFLKREVEGNIETIRNEIIEMDLLDQAEQNDLHDKFGEDDPEDGYYKYGLACDFTDELVYITLDTLCEGLNDWLVEYLKEEENSDTDLEYINMKTIRDKIEKWRAYDLYF